MIAKFKGNNSAADTFNYQEKEKSKEIFKKNLAGDCIKDYLRQFNLTQSQYQMRSKRMVIHCIISPTIEDGKKLSEKDFVKIGELYLKKIGLEAFQAVGYLHGDREHNHLHIVASSINKNTYKQYDFSNEYKQNLSKKVAIEICQELGLTIAETVRLEKQKKNELGISEDPVGAKQKFAADIQAVLNDRPQTHIEFFDMLIGKGYDVREYYTDDTHELRGYGLFKDDTFLNASQIDKAYTLTQLEKIFKIHVDKKVIRPYLNRIHKKEKKPVKKSLDYSNSKVVRGLINDFKYDLIKDAYRESKMMDDMATILTFGIFTKVRNQNKISVPRKIEEKENAPEIKKQNRIISNNHTEKDWVKELVLIADKTLFAADINLVLKENPKNHNAYFDLLRKKDYEVIEFYNNETGELRGYALRKDDVQLNAAEIDRKFTMTNLEKIFGVQPVYNTTIVKPTQQETESSPEESIKPKGLRL